MSELKNKLLQGFNHTYTYDIEISNFPKPTQRELLQLLDRIALLCDHVGAEYKVEIEND